MSALSLTLQASSALYSTLVPLPSKDLFIYSLLSLANGTELLIFPEFYLYITIFIHSRIVFSMADSTRRCSLHTQVF